MASSGSARLSTGLRTGGTIYNARLLDALERRGARVDAVSLEEGRRALMARACSRAWVDSLYMGEIPELRRANVARVPLGLVTHYLPSLVALGRSPEHAELTSVERAAISGVDGFLTTSPFLTDVLSGLGVARTKIVSVTPGIDVDTAPAPASERAPGDPGRIHGREPATGEGDLALPLGACAHCPVERAHAPHHR